jgi:spore maturation protein CgeB
MKCLLYGEATSPGSGAWCYAETLREMGHEVFVFNENNKLDRYAKRLIPRAYHKITGKLWEAHRRLHVTALHETVRREQPEIIIILKGLYITPEDVYAMRASGAWVVNINHDDFFSQNNNNWSVIQRGAIPAYNHIFTTRLVNVEEVRPHNTNVEFFPFAYYPRIHRPVPIPKSEQKRWNVDVVFIGTWERERCQLLEYLVTRVPARYAIYGSQWDKVRRRSPLKPFLHRKTIVMDDMAKAISGAQLSLAFLRKENRDDYTQRTFEIPACGGVLLAERTPMHKTIYKEGKEAEFFDPTSPNELTQKVSRLLDDKQHQEALRRKGRAALLQQRHTYRDRMDYLLKMYNSWVKNISEETINRSAHQLAAKVV